MPASAVNGITIAHETAGNPADPPLLLIHGLGAQLISWDPDFVDALVAKSFYVVRFDNRDVGLSTWFDEAGTPDVMAAVAGEVEVPYLLSDMADDTAGLLDALGIESAHVIGVSMGGMIAQSLAIAYPQRVRTLTSIMSTTGDQSVGQPTDECIAWLLSPAPSGRAATIEAALKTAHVIGSPGFPFHEDRVLAKAEAEFDRGNHPSGTLRQLVGIISSPDRTPHLKGLDLPTLVIHGEEDPLIQPNGGRATADAIPGASLWMIPGMGHHLPPELFDEVIQRIAALCGV